MMCELCGKETEESFKASIEGTEMNVCDACAKFGKVIARRAPAAKEMKPEKMRTATPSAPEMVESIVPDFPKIVRDRREALSLNQEDFAKTLSIKESMLHKIETGDFTPSIALARKMEKVLRTKIVEVKEERQEHVIGRPGGNSPVTIGDFIKIRKK
jgi:putative transcription factor